jgi:15-cis-phytoene desaturase
MSITVAPPSFTNTFIFFWLTVLGGKLAAEVVAERAAGIKSTRIEKMMQESVVLKALKYAPRDPVGVLGEGAVAFGGGAVMTGGVRKVLESQDPVQLLDV